MNNKTWKDTKEEEEEEVDGYSEVDGDEEVVDGYSDIESGKKNNITLLLENGTPISTIESKIENQANDLITLKNTSEVLLKNMETIGRELQEINKKKDRAEPKSFMNHFLGTAKDNNTENTNKGIILTWEEEMKKKNSNHEIIVILTKVRNNCIVLSNYHNKRHYFFKNLLFYSFRVPLIIFSGINTFIAIGMQNYLKQESISIINAIISLVSGIATSIELLLNLQKKIEEDAESYRHYYKLSIDLYNDIERFVARPETLDIMMTAKTAHMTEYFKLLNNGNPVNYYNREFRDNFETDIYTWEDQHSNSYEFVRQNNVQNAVKDQHADEKRVVYYYETSPLHMVCFYCICVSRCFMGCLNALCRRCKRSSC